MSFSKKLYNKFFSKSPKVANLSQNATGRVKLLETLEYWLLFKKERGFSKKNLHFLKHAKGTKFAVDCD